MAKHAGVIELENTIGRLRAKLSTAERGHKNWYEKNRLLENRIRAAIKVGETIDPDKLYALVTSVPKNPRKKWGWRRG